MDNIHPEPWPVAFIAYRRAKAHTHGPSELEEEKKKKSSRKPGDQRCALRNAQARCAATPCPASNLRPTGMEFPSNDNGIGLQGGTLKIAEFPDRILPAGPRAASTFRDGCAKSALHPLLVHIPNQPVHRPRRSAGPGSAR